MKKSLCLFLSWSLFVFTFPVNIKAAQGSFKQEGSSIAILDMEGQGIPQLAAKTLTDFMRFELEETGVVATVQSSQIKEILIQMGLDETGCTSAECALQIGDLLGVSHVVIGSIRSQEQVYNLSCQMYNIETGAVQKTVNRVYEGDVDGLTIALQRLVWEITDLTPPPGRFPEEQAVPTTPFMIFTSNDWNIPQTVTVYGVDDKIDDGDMLFTIAMGAVVSNDGNYYAKEPSNVSVVNIDNDESGIVVVPTGELTTTEAEGTDTLTMVLMCEPTAEVTVSLSSSDTTEGTISPSSLIFDASNWNISQTVVVKGKDDHIDDGNQIYSIEVQPAISADVNYNGFEIDDVKVTNRDNDKAGIKVHPVRGLITTEVGGEATVSVVLTSQPEADVEFVLSSSDTTEGVVSPQLLSFTSENWNSVRTVTVTGVDDEDKKDQPYRIVFDPAVSSDKKYSGLKPDDVSVINKDNQPGVIVYPIQGLTLPEAGDDTSFTLQLTSEPTADVVFSVVSSDTTEGTVSPSSVTFSAHNWNRSQIITVTGVDDEIDDGDQTYTIIVNAAISTDPNYSGKNPDDVSVTNVNDDEAGILVDPNTGLITREEGGTAEFTVVLSSEPLENVTLSLISIDTTEGKVLPLSLIFTPGNWDSSQTVFITGVDDDVDDGDVAYKIDVGSQVTSYDRIYEGMSSLPVWVTNINDDTKGIMVSPASGLITSEEGGIDTFTVKLTSQPLSDVVLSFSCSDSTEGVVLLQSLVFSRNNWNTPQAVTVAGINDEIYDGDQAFSVITEAAISADPNYDALDPSDVAATNRDNDEKGIRINPTTGLTTTEKRSMASFTVVLTSEPAANVTFSLSSSDITEGTVSPTLMTFTGDNWDVTQTVFVSGVDDEVDDGDQTYAIVLGSIVSNDPAYNGLDLDDVSLTNRDDDGPGIVMFPSEELTTTEAGGTATIRMKLASEPSADVTVSLRTSDEIIGIVSPLSVTLTPDTWNMPQKLTITGMDDAVDDGDQSYVIMVDPAISNDPDYSSLDPIDVVVTNKDDDGPGIIVYPTSGITTDESGDEGTFTVVLTSEPSSLVTLSLSCSDGTEGSVSPSSITFKRRNWNIPQTVTISGLNDYIDDGDQAYSVIIEAAVSADDAYNGLDPDDVWVINEDDDEAGIFVDTDGKLITTEGGSVVSLKIKLSSQPAAADVTVMLRSSDVGEGIVSPLSLTFSRETWNIAQTVTITGVNDDVDDGDQSFFVAVDSVISSDAAYNGINLEDISIINVDDDESGITLVAKEELITTEAGAIDTFTVVLTSEPVSEVTLSLSSTDEKEGVVSPSSITFSSGNWNKVQTITVTGIDDNLDDGDQSYTIITSELSSADTNYDSLDPLDISVSNMDNDFRGITITPTSGLTTTESGSTATFIVELTSEPTADVTFSLSSSDTAEGIVSPASLAFTSTNWNIPRTVTVTGVDDSLFLLNDSQSYEIITHQVVSDDINYNGLNPDDVLLTNKGDDGPGIIVYPTGILTTTEARDSTTFTVVLTYKATAGVALSLSSSDATEGTISPTLLNFSTENWDTPQTVTVTGVNDEVDDGDQPYTIVIGPAFSGDHFYRGMDPDDVLVINQDDDEYGIIVNPTSGFTTTEAGSTATLTIVLTSEPTAEVVLSLSSSDETEGLVSPSTVMFNQTNWISPQRITITGVQDNIDDGNQFYSVIIGPAISNDDNYNNIDPDNPLVANIDVDEADIKVDPVTGLMTTETGVVDTVTVVLTSQPESAVTMSVTCSDSTEGIIWPQTLTFSTSNWDMPQIITVTGVNDDVDDGDQPYVVVIDSAISSDPIYSGMNPMDISIINVDDDAAGIIVEPIDGLVTTETGDMDTFTVVLTSEPIADVIISLSTSDDTEGSLWPPARPVVEEEEPVMAFRGTGTLSNLWWWIKGNYQIVLVVAVLGGGAAALILPGGKVGPTIEKPPIFPEVP